MEAQPSGINITLVSSVEEKRKAHLFWAWYCTNCHSGASTQRDQTALHALGSRFSSEENQQERKNGNTAGQYLDKNRVPIRAAFFPQCVLSCGGSGMARGDVVKLNS